MKCSKPIKIPVKVPRIPRVARLVAVIAINRAFQPLLASEDLNSRTIADTSHIVINVQKKKVRGLKKMDWKNKPNELIGTFTELI